MPQSALTSRERVLRAARRQTPDRVPRIVPLESYVQQRMAAHFAGRDLSAALKLDTLGIYPAPTRLENDYAQYFSRSGVSWEEWGRGRVWDPLGQYAEYLYPLERAETADEILAYPWPDLTEPYRYAALEAQAAALHARGYAVLGGLEESVFEIAWQLRSMDRLFADILSGDEKAALLLDQITLRREAAARAYAAAGADILALGDDVAMQTGLLMSPRMFREWFQPRLARIIQAARAVRPEILVQYHSDGKINDLIPNLIEIGVDILNPVQPECVEHAWVKAAHGERLAFSGGLGVQSVLPFGSPAEVREHVRRVIQTLGAGGGLIVGPSHVIERDVSLENILAMLSAIDEFGEY